MPLFLLLHAHHLILGLVHGRCPYPLIPLLTSVLQWWWRIPMIAATAHNSLLSTFRLNLRTFSGSPGSRHSLEVQGSQPLIEQGQRPQPSMLPRSRVGTQLPTAPCHLIRFLLTSVFCELGKNRPFFVCLFWVLTENMLTTGLEKDICSSVRGTSLLGESHGDGLVPWTLARAQLKPLKVCVK